jgi:CheY-like chemotaxis protein
VKILVVDDSKYILEVMALLLNDDKHIIETASDSKIALDFLEKQKFDLIITDINMPGMSGFDLSFEVRKKDPLTPVILFTGQINRHKDYKPLLDKLGNSYYVEGKDLNELVNIMGTIFPKI